MNSTHRRFRHVIFGKPLRMLICAGLASGITALTTQMIVSSAGQHEYQTARIAHISSAQMTPAHADRDRDRRITVARLR